MYGLLNFISPYSALLEISSGRREGQGLGSRNKGGGERQYSKGCAPSPLNAPQPNTRLLPSSSPTILLSIAPCPSAVSSEGLELERSL